MSTSQQNNRAGSGGERRPTTKRRRRKKRSLGATIVMRFFQALGTLFLVGIVTGCFLACYATVYIQTVVIPESGLDLSKYTLNESSVIYYTDPETGEDKELITLSGTEDRKWVNYDEIPKHLINAAVAIEDERFWTHQGVDWKRTAVAILYMFTGKDIQGGSTITQQLIKNLTEENEVTVKRKIGEIFNALEFEKNYEKEDIITWYLNKIYLGQKKYGVATAAHYYFGKDLSEITLAEAASIIAITNNPSIYSPASTVVVETSKGEKWSGMQWNKYRQELILAKMLENEYITQAEYEEAVAQELEFAFDDDNKSSITSIFPWYVEAVIDEVLEHLIEMYGISKETAYDIVYSGGLAIYTPYDPNVQNCVDEIYKDTENLDYISNRGEQMQSAITIIDNSNGYVVAMAGKIGEKAGNRELNNATNSPRQPGSSLKPLSAYSPAIEMGLITPGTIVDDSPYMILNELPWPINSSLKYRGLVTIETAVQRSLNTIATKLVAEYVTPDVSYQFLTERYGLTTLVERMEVGGQIKSDIDVAPLAMGGLTRGVTTYEMAAAFATFPRRGAYTDPTTVLRVETKAGEVIWDNEPETEYVIKESTAYYMNKLLANAAAHGTGTGALVDGQIIAGKTGTTSQNFDRWFAGYTSYYTGVVWTGYPTNTSMEEVTGNPASKLWKKVMTLVHEDLEQKEFFAMDNVVPVSICLDCGGIATEACVNDIRNILGDSTGKIVSRVQTMDFLAGDEPTNFCTCHVPVTICTADPILDETGLFTGGYHFAGDNCPAESRRRVYIVERTRTEAEASAVTQDMAFLTYYYETMMIPDCTVHNVYVPPVEEIPGELPSDPGTTDTPDDPLDFDWSTFDPFDISTWPFDPYSDPSTWPFDPFDSTTWPEPDDWGDTPPEDEYLPVSNRFS